MYIQQSYRFEDEFRIEMFQLDEKSKPRRSLTNVVKCSISNIGKPEIIMPASHVMSRRVSELGEPD